MDSQYESPDVVLGHYLDQIQHTIEDIRLRFLPTSNTPQVTEHPGDKYLHHLRFSTNPLEEIAMTAQLTAREREVLPLICDALTNKEIASELFIGERTAKHHVESILGKTGFKNRRQLIRNVLNKAGSSSNKLSEKDNTPVKKRAGVDDGKQRHT